MKLLPNQQILTVLRCPICHGEMTLSPEEGQGSRSLLCKGVRKHCFDLSASGYVNLMAPGHTAGGDSKQAVRARTDFLNGDYYRPVAEALSGALAKYVTPEEGVVVDAGCGEGYYTAALARGGFSCAGFDLSKFAVDTAAKRLAREDRAGFFSVSSVFEMPMRDGSASAVVNVFAPCAEEEYRRVLRDGGYLFVAYAGPDHLMGLKKAIYEVARGNDGRADLPRGMTPVEEIRVRFDICVEGKEPIMNLFAMTPYYWKTSVSDGEKLSRMDRLSTEVDVILGIYQKNENRSDGQKGEDLCRSR